MIAELATTFCLATVVHLEARGELPLGQRAVAHVVVNRSKKYHRPICSVAWHRQQFAVKILSKETRESKSFQNSMKIATMVINGQSIDPTRGSTYFHAAFMRPYWADSKQFKIKIGSHLFYR